MNRFFVKDYIGKAHSDTDAVQQAINDCAKVGGQVVLDGVYTLSTVFLKSGVHILLCGAQIYGSLDFNNYAPHEDISYPLYQDASHSYFHTSMFVAEDCTDISITGSGMIDMRSVWDEENIRNMAHRGAKCIAFKNCKNVAIGRLSIINATDLAVYLAGCDNVEIYKLDLKVYIDGISPDNCHNVKIYDCNVISGDDGIVFKSSYTLNRFEKCKDITVENCTVKSRCNAIKFGTETNGGFENISVKNCVICDTRISGIAVESVDGAEVSGLTFENIKMKNVGTPVFVHLGKRLRGPSGIQIGSIKNIVFKNIVASGPYVGYLTVPWNYQSFLEGDDYQDPQIFGLAEGFDGLTPTEEWQISSNVCGLKGHMLENIVFENVSITVYGGVSVCEADVPEDAKDYPEAYVYGRILPAKGVFFRHIDGLLLKNVTIKTMFEDNRQDFVFNDVINLKRE